MLTQNTHAQDRCCTMRPPASDMTVMILPPEPSRKSVNFCSAGSNVVSAPVPSDWWKLYKDPRLDELVRQAMASNTDLRVAAANLQRARFQTQQAESAGGWSLGDILQWIWNALGDLFHGWSRGAASPRGLTA